MFSPHRELSCDYPYWCNLKLIIWHICLSMKYLCLRIVIMEQNMVTILNKFWTLLFNRMICISFLIWRNDLHKWYHWVISRSHINGCSTNISKLLFVDKTYENNIKPIAISKLVTEYCNQFINSTSCSIWTTKIETTIQII